MPDFHLSLSFNVFAIFLAAVSAAAFSMFVYRFTVPPVSLKVRSILIFLRSIGIFLLFILLGEPLFLLIRHYTEQPIVAVLVDDSESMSIKDQTGKRSEHLKSVLKLKTWQEIKKIGDVSFALFDGKLRNVKGFTEDSTSQRGEATDIAGALKSVKQMYETANLQAVIIISDGNSTIGENPIYEAEDLGIPVFTVGIGDTSEQKDILVRKIVSNEIVYSGTKVPVSATIHSTGFEGEHVVVSLNDGKEMLDEKTITLERGTRDYNIQMFFVPEKEGTQKYTVNISTLSGELTARNNQTSFFTKILKSKLHVSLIAGAPSQDVAVIKRLFENNKNFDVNAFIEQSNGQFYNNNLTEQSINNMDCLVLVGFPSANSSQQNIQMVFNAVGAGKPFMIILSRTVDYTRLRILDSAMPFNIDNLSRTEIQIFTVIPDAQRDHPIIKSGENLNTIDAWSKLPPIFRLNGNYHSKIGSEIIAAIRQQTSQINEPFIVTRNVNKKKSIAILGYGLWRWNMLSETQRESGQELESLLNNSIRWLTTQEDTKRIRVRPSKQIFSAQEAAEFYAQVYDENYQPINNAQIEVRSQRGKEVIPLSLNSLGNGQYQEVYNHLNEGEYKYTATVSVDGKFIDEDHGSFTIGGLNAEYLETRMNKPLLQQIAAHTGGNYYDSNNLELLTQDIKTNQSFAPQHLSKSAEFEIWNSRWMIALIIIVFALEWFLRKRNGML